MTQNYNYSSLMTNKNNTKLICFIDIIHILYVNLCYIFPKQRFKISPCFPVEKHPYNKAG